MQAETHRDFPADLTRKRKEAGNAGNDVLSLVRPQSRGSPQNGVRWEIRTKVIGVHGNDVAVALRELPGVDRIHHGPGAMRIAVQGIRLPGKFARASGPFRGRGKRRRVMS